MNKSKKSEGKNDICPRCKDMEFILHGHIDCTVCEEVDNEREHKPKNWRDLG